MFQRLSLPLWLKPNIIDYCAVAFLAIGAPAIAQAGDQTEYIVDGLALGGSVAPRSATYKEYKCQPSEQFENFIWCQRQRKENGKFGEFTSFTSILHSDDNATAYVSRYIVPAYFSAGDIRAGNRAAFATLWRQSSSAAVAPKGRKPVGSDCLLGQGYADALGCC
jgi:hypothetical protein